MVRRRNIGGVQLPLDIVLPPSDWRPPSELPDLRRMGPDLAVDYESRDDGLAAGLGPGWAFGMCRIVGVAMAAGDRRVYVPLSHPETECHDTDAVRRWVTDHMRGPQRKIFHNAMYDLGCQLGEWGLEAPELLDDTMCMAFSLDENRLQYNLDAVCAWLGVQGKDEELLRQAAAAYGVDPKAELYKLPARFVGPYAEQDAGATLEAARIMRDRIAAQDLGEAYRLEADLIPMCVAMRARGVRVNLDHAERSAQYLSQQARTALDELTDKLPIGRRVEIGDVSSPRFMSRVFDSLSIPYPRTAKGNPSFSSDWMSRADHWLPQLAARAQKFNDAAEKFVRGYIVGFQIRGRIHAEIHSHRDDRGGTRTTRFAYSDPPLQQMPARDPDIKKLIRGIFVPEDGEIWGALDYSQQEFRLMVHFASLCGMAGVEDAVRKYREDPRTDFHNLAAELTRLPRRKAKDVNFAKAFGAGVPKFADMTGMSLDEAKATMAQYDQELPFISRLSEFCQNRADRRGYIRLLDGARGRFERWEPRWQDWTRYREAQEAARAAGRPEPVVTPCEIEEARRRMADPDHPWTGRLRRAFTHKAMNTLIQGSAARQTKLAMRECWREGILPLLQMHDELDFSFGERAPALRAEEIMRDTVRLEVPVVVDAEFGRDWGDATHEWDEAWQRLAA